MAGMAVRIQKQGMRIFFLCRIMARSICSCLANAFLLAAIAVPVWHRVKSRPSLRQSCVLASLALGLSFSANYSFAFAGLAVFFAITAWAIRRRAGEPVLNIVGLCALPGLFVALLLCGYPMM